MIIETNEIVIGSGVLGRAVARLLRAQGRRVTVLNRSGGRVDAQPAIACDLSAAGELERHLGDSARLFVCAAPAYHRWREEFPLLVDGLRRAVKGRRADIVYADNLYAYGPSERALIEAMPYAASTVKGKVRADAAVRLMDLHGSEGVRVAIVRAADFYGPGVENSVVGLRVIRAVLASRPAYLIGDPDMVHALTYLPDFARCMVTLAGESAAFGEAWHVPNSPPVSLRAFLAKVAQTAGTTLNVRAAGPWMLRTMGLFDPGMRELVEMLYQFDRPFLVNHDKIAQRFGLAATALDAGVRETVDWARTQA